MQRRRGSAHGSAAAPDSTTGGRQTKWGSPGSQKFALSLQSAQLQGHVAWGMPEQPRTRPPQSRSRLRSTASEHALSVHELEAVRHSETTRQPLEAQRAVGARHPMMCAMRAELERLEEELGVLSCLRPTLHERWLSSLVRRALHAWQSRMHPGWLAGDGSRRIVRSSLLRGVASWRSIKGEMATQKHRLVRAARHLWQRRASRAWQGWVSTVAEQGTLVQLLHRGTSGWTLRQMLRGWSAWMQAMLMKARLRAWSCRARSHALRQLFAHAWRAWAYEARALAVQANRLRNGASAFVHWRLAYGFRDWSLALQLVRSERIGAAVKCVLCQRVARAWSAWVAAAHVRMQRRANTHRSVMHLVGMLERELSQSWRSWVGVAAESITARAEQVRLVQLGVGHSAHRLLATSLSSWHSALALREQDESCWSASMAQLRRYADGF